MMWESFVLIGFLLSFTSAMLIIPWIDKRLVQMGYVAPDRYKINRPLIPKGGGLVTMIFVVFLLAMLPPIIYALDRFLDLNSDFLFVNQAALMIIMLYGIFGIVDDIIRVGHLPKAVLPFVFGFPIVIFVNPEVLNFLIFEVDLDTPFGAIFGVDVKLSFWFKLIVIPLYISVCANLINMHSGFNGLATGTTSIVMGALLLRGAFNGYIQETVAIIMLYGSLLAVFWYNKYPARTFEGNIGSLMNGAMIGVTVVATNSYTAGFIMLIPHSLDFLLFCYTRFGRGIYDKFGKLRTDGTIEAPDPYKMKFIFPYYFKLSEKQTVLVLYAVTGAFCAIGVFVPH